MILKRENYAKGGNETTAPTQEPLFSLQEAPPASPTNPADSPHPFFSPSLLSLSVLILCTYTTLDGKGGASVSVMCCCSVVRFLRGSYKLYPGVLKMDA